jgi:hypothetical protein
LNYGTKNETRNALALLATIGGALFFSIAARIPEKEPR